MITTRRLFLGMVACLPLAWQIKLGAVPMTSEWTCDSEAWCWWHTTFNGCDSVVEFLRVRYNIASRGGLIRTPREVILGAKAYAQLAQELRHVRIAMGESAASFQRFKDAEVHSLEHSRGWDDWHVGFLVSPRGAHQLAEAHSEGRI